jgi:hypothetical protein
MIGVDQCYSKKNILTEQCQTKFKLNFNFWMGFLLKGFVFSELISNINGSVRGKFKLSAFSAMINGSVRGKFKLHPFSATM